MQKCFTRPIDYECRLQDWFASSTQQCNRFRCCCCCCCGKIVLKRQLSVKCSNFIICTKVEPFCRCEIDLKACDITFHMTDILLHNHIFFQLCTLKFVLLCMSTFRCPVRLLFVSSCPHVAYQSGQGFGNPCKLRLVWGGEG